MVAGLSCRRPSARSPMSDIVIRHAEPSDLEGIKAIYAQPHAYANTLQLPYPSDTLWAKRLSEPPEGLVSLVAEMSGQIAGQLALSTRMHPRRRHVAGLGMGVNADFRRMGVGTALLTEALDLAERWLAVTRLEIEVYADNEAGIGLYEKHGFEREGLCANYAFRDGDYVDAILMARLRGRDDEGDDG